MSSSLVTEQIEIKDKTLDLSLEQNRLSVSNGSFSYNISAPFVKLELDLSNEEKVLKLSSIKKWKKKLQAVAKTWRKEIEKLSLRNVYYYRIEWLSKKFPMVLEWSENKNSLKVENFLGYKTTLMISFSPQVVQFHSLKDNVLILKSFDDIKAGSEVALCHNLRKLLNRNLSFKVFEAGALITKHINKIPE